MIVCSNSEDPQRWLFKESSWTIDRLRSFAPLPFKQGILVEFQQPNIPGDNPANNMVLCILQDFQRTSNFLFYLTGKPTIRMQFKFILIIQWSHSKSFYDLRLSTSCKL